MAVIIKTKSGYSWRYTEDIELEFRKDERIDYVVLVHAIGHDSFNIPMEVFDIHLLDTIESIKGVD